MSLWDNLEGGKITYPEDKRQEAAQDCERPMIKPYAPKSNIYAPREHKSNIDELRKALGDGKCKN